jgi:TetR/AcrR family transcriptional regulator, transcriptional repressor for nem operon
MGRPKTYDREDVTRKAMQLFWEQGFEATSTKALAEHMGINVYSLFAEFESKQGLFEAALALYRNEVVANVFGMLEEPGAGLDAIEALFDFFAAGAGKRNAKRGCLACNVATERAASDSASHDYVIAHVTFIEQGLYRALHNAKARGELCADVSCRDQIRLLTSVILGLSVLMRAGAERAFITNAVRAARRDLDRLRA